MASSYRGQNQSTAYFNCWPKCAHGCNLWLVLTVILTTLNNTRQCFYQPKTVDSFWPVNVDSVDRLLKCTRYTFGKYISTFWLILTLAVTQGLKQAMKKSLYFKIHVFSINFLMHTQFARVPARHCLAPVTPHHHDCFPGYRPGTVWHPLHPTTMIVVQGTGPALSGTRYTPPPWLFWRVRAVTSIVQLSLGRM